MSQPAEAVQVPAEVKPLPTIAPGIYPDISNHAYHRGPGVSKSGLDLIVERSPLHYWDMVLNPDRPTFEQTPAMVMGSAMHKYVLEPLSFNDEFVVAPEGIDRRTKDGKAKWAEFQLAAAGKAVLEPDQLERVRGMANAVLNHPLARRILENGKAEQSVYWKDPETGVLCKARPDWQTDSSIGLMADLKSTGDASMAEFQRSINNFGYHRQAPWYLDGWAEVTGDRHTNFVFIAVESLRPYAVAVYAIDDAAIAHGRKELRKALQTYARCLETNTWPGFGENVTAISLPPWAFKKAV